MSYDYGSLGICRFIIKTKTVQNCTPPLIIDRIAACAYLNIFVEVHVLTRQECSTIQNFTIIHIVIYPYLNPPQLCVCSKLDPRFPMSYVQVYYCVPLDRMRDGCSFSWYW